MYRLFYVLVFLMIGLGLFSIINQRGMRPMNANRTPTQASSTITYPSLDPLFLKRAFDGRLPWTLAESTRIALVPHHLIAAREIASLFSSLPPARTIIIISPDHFSQGKTIFTIPSSDFCRRYGQSKDCQGGYLNRQRLEQLTEHVPNVSINNMAFEREHGIYALLPFLAQTHPNARIVPILIKTDATQQETNSLTEYLEQILREDPEILLLGSIDMSHYQTQEIANFHDILTRHIIETQEVSRISSLEIDSPGTLYVALGIAKRLGLAATVHSHTNSLILGKALLERESTSHIIASFATTSFSTTPDMPPLETTFWHQLPKIPTTEDRLYKGFDKERLFKEPSLPYFFGIVTEGNVITIHPFPFDDQRILLTRKQRTDRIQKDLSRLHAWLSTQFSTNTYELIY